MTIQVNILLIVINLSISTAFNIRRYIPGAPCSTFQFEQLIACSVLRNLYFFFFKIYIIHEHKFDKRFLENRESAKARQRKLSALGVAIKDGLDMVEPDVVDGKEDGGSSHTGREDAHHVITARSHGEGGGVDNVSHAC